MYCAISGIIETMKYFLDRGSFLLEKRGKGKDLRNDDMYFNIFACAARHGHDKMVLFIYNFLMEKIKENAPGYDLNSVDKFLNQQSPINGHTGYMLACMDEHHIQTVEIIVKKCLRVDLTIKDKNGKIGSNYLMANSNHVKTFKRWLCQQEKNYTLPV